MLHTTFALAREAGACQGSYRAVAKALGGIPRYGRDTPIPLSRILEVSGLEDALWCLRCVLPEEAPARDRLARLLSCDYADRIAPLWVAPPGEGWVPADTISVARRYAIGQATAEELQVARDAASAAAIAANSASYTACSASYTAYAVADTAVYAVADTAATYAAAYAARATYAADTTRATAERAWQAQRLRERLEADHAD